MQRYGQNNFENNDQTGLCPMMDRCDRNNSDKSRNYMDEKSLAMAYVPWQKEPEIYEDLEKAYCIGTVFPALNFPFCGKR